MTGITWNNLEDMQADFWPSYDGRKLTDEFDGVTILLASYGALDYAGDAFVLFERDGSLYEVNGSHCSCYGLEGQWDPEETTIAGLRHRVDEGNLGQGDWGNTFADDLRKVLDDLEGIK